MTSSPAQVTARRNTPSWIRDRQAGSVQDRRVHTRLTLGSHRDRRPGHSPDRTVRGADDRIIPSCGFTRSGPGKPSDVPDAELVCLMDATSVPCGAAAVTAGRSGLYGRAGYGYCPTPFPLVLGRQAADHLHLRRDDGDRVRPGERCRPGHPVAAVPEPPPVTGRGRTAGKRPRRSSTKSMEGRCGSDN
jgi:hypothetical protein